MRLALHVPDPNRATRVRGYRGQVHIGLLTREWPPEVYGGAGVHVEFLVPRLRELDRRRRALLRRAARPARACTRTTRRPASSDANQALRTLSADLSITAAVDGVDLVHSHTWYANLAGHLAKLLYGIPHVITAHSLEPRRPWKAEQLGGGYRLSSWVEKTAYEAADAIIAVSEGMRADVLDCYPSLDPERVQVVRNGIDSTAYHPVTEDDALRALRRRPGPADRGVRRADHPAEGRRAPGRGGAPRSTRTRSSCCARARRTRRRSPRRPRPRWPSWRPRGPACIWIQKMLQPAEVRQLLSHATVFVCPSVYEPLGIVNLEAMACGTAVVASDVGGIPEVVDDGRTGPAGALRRRRTSRRSGPGSRTRSTRCSPTPSARRRMGAAGRERAEQEFSWAHVAEQTVEVYRSVRP